ncbi:hypothetical protein C2G38_2228124 [Gigaspora rosea]|uniref:Uncharacterized protein n=1 Tax=Gigaspora rosea TaxID=44941 RepID=A0A397TWA6_9GLOM|nr:hypothetical protein C2G38_2228124 [Gigaspora rosea]
MFAEDMSLVTDNNIDGRKGWKKSKYGRAVSVKRIRRNDGTELMIDPSLYKNNLQKFSDNTIDVKPKPLDQVTYFYNDFINLSDDEKKKHQNDNSTSENDGQNGNIPSPDKLPQSIIDSLKKLKNKSRVVTEAIKQRALEKKAVKDKISQALRKDDGSTVIKYF